MNTHKESTGGWKGEGQSGWRGRWRDKERLLWELGEKYGGRVQWREGKEHVDDFARMISLIEKTP